MMKMMLMMIMVMMADVGASYHGGAGGNDPPHGHAYNLAAQCETSDPVERKRRGRGQNKKLVKKFQENGERPLRLEMRSEGKHVKMVGPNQSEFSRLFSTHIRERVPLYYKSWNDVPQEFKDELVSNVHHYFDIEDVCARNSHRPRVQELVSASIQRECQRSYSERKYEMHQHYKSIEDPEEARATPPDGIDQHHWIEMIERLWSDEQYNRRCQANSANRAHVPYESYHGSKSYNQLLWEEESKGTTYVDAFETTHRKKNQGPWVNERAQEDHQRLVAEQEQLRKSQQDGGQYSEAEAFKRVFGEKRGHLRGIGKLLPKAFRCSSGGSSSSGSRNSRLDQLELMQEQLRTQQEEHERQMKATQDALLRQMQEQQTQHQRQMDEIYAKYNQDYEHRYQNMHGWQADNTIDGDGDEDEDEEMDEEEDEDD